MGQTQRAGHMDVSNTVDVSNPAAIADNRRALEASLAGDQSPRIPL